MSPLLAAFWVYLLAAAVTALGAGPLFLALTRWARDDELPKVREALDVASIHPLCAVMVFGLIGVAWPVMVSAGLYVVFWLFVVDPIVALVQRVGRFHVIECGSCSAEFTGWGAARTRARAQAGRWTVLDGGGGGYCRACCAPDAGPAQVGA